MKRNFSSFGIIFTLCLLPASSAFGQQLVMTGRVIAADGRGIENATVVVHRQNTPHRATTSAQGDYRIELPSGPLVDYIVFEHANMIPKVVVGPFSGSTGSQINVILMAANVKAMSLPATLGTIQSIQFLKLIEARADANIPPTLTIQPQLKLAAQSVDTGAGKDQVTPSERSKAAQPKAASFWPMDDAFFRALKEKK